MSESEQKEEVFAPSDNGAALNDPSSTAAAQSQDSSKPPKITLLLKATGNAPIFKQERWMVEQNRNVASIITFVRKRLKLQATESLFLYVNQSFAPAPDQILKTLYDCFKTDDRLILHYAITPAWG